LTWLYDRTYTRDMKRKSVPQAAKVRNEKWRDARLIHSNLNLTVPSGKVYKRPKAGGRNRDW